MVNRRDKSESLQDDALHAHLESQLQTEGINREWKERFMTLIKSLVSKQNKFGLPTSEIRKDMAGYITEIKVVAKEETGGRRENELQEIAVKIGTVIEKYQGMLRVVDTVDTEDTPADIRELFRQQKRGYRGRDRPPDERWAA